MRRYIFNDEYFKTTYNGESPKIEGKIDYLCKKCDIADDTFRAKRAGKRNFTDGDYDIVYEHDKMLLLDTHKLLHIFLNTATRDFTPNQKYVSYIMLCAYDEKKRWVSLEDLEVMYEFKRNKVSEILRDGKILIDKNNTKENMFLKKIIDGKECFKINISAFIKYISLV